MPGLLRAWLHLAVLWAFAVAQPLFGVLEDSPEFFVARGNTQGDVILFAVGVALIPPTLLWLVELALSRWERVRRAVHLVVIGGLVLAIALQAFKDLRPGPGFILIALALALAAGAAWAYARTAVAPTVLTVLSPAPLIVMLLFLFASPVTDLFASDEDVPVRQDVRRSAPVVMVVFDEFSVETIMDPRGGIDAARFPNLAALSREATWYRNGTSVADHTTDAVPAILTGRYPTKDFLPTAADNPRNLFTLLGNAYDLDNVSEPATDLCPAKLCGEASGQGRFARLKSLGRDLTVVAGRRILPNRLAEKLPVVNQGFADFGGGSGEEASVPGTAFKDRPTQFRAFVDHVRPDGLNFLHILLPHTPWEYRPDGTKYPGPDGAQGVGAGGIWLDDPDNVRGEFDKYRDQAQFVDRLVGRLVASLKAEGIWKDTLLVMTADHGISFRIGQSRRTPRDGNASDILGVPMFVKPPGQTNGGADDRRATNADLLPTIADALGVTLRWRTDGVSLLAPPRDPPPPLSISTYPTRDRLTIPFADYVRARDAEVERQPFGP